MARSETSMKWLAYGKRTDFSNWKTGRCCRTWCFTADTSVVRTQYLVVDRTKPCRRPHKHQQALWMRPDSSTAQTGSCHYRFSQETEGLERPQRRAR